MTVTDENSTAVKETESVSPAEKRTLYVLISELGEYFAHVFIIIIKFLGLCGMYVIAMFYKAFTYFEKPLKQFLQKAKDTFISPFKRHRKARKLGSTEIAKARREKGAWGGFMAWLKVAGRTVFGKRGVLATVVNWGLPVLSCVFLINIVSYANNQNYALKLSVNGDFVCYINDENSFTEAEKIVQNRINYTGSSTEIISFEPTFEVESVGNADLLNQYQIADKMLALLGKEVKEGYGLYLGNSYYGTLSSHGKLDSAMEDLLGQYSTGEEKETVQFDKQINYIHGTYLADSFVNEDDIIKQFTSVKKVASYYTIEDGDYLDLVLEKTGMTVEDLESLNPEFDDNYKFRTGEKLKISAEEPFLTVMVTREEHYTEFFEFETRYEDDSLLYAGNKRIMVEGEEGERAVVANVSYINGSEISRQVLSKTVTKEPVTKVIAVGTKPRTNTTAPGQTIGQGLMLWPVGGYDGGEIGEPVWWHGGYAGHKGVDILAPYGTPVYAAENGVVVAAVYDGGYNGGRGNYVTIQGDSGYTTYYYHNSSVVAYSGQRVIAGDLIAYVGQTGRAYGNHLHFGVSVGDTFLNPTDFLPWHKRTAACAAKEY
ncbi:MAG: peptidoglycan DD-metalloendopeptidase family protein [Oscillospiraceae bacterium]|nr:peptidoglycan DD-metalloendopeptidase family protein [Oscillospiraceae bacterium]